MFVAMDVTCSPLYSAYFLDTMIYLSLCKQVKDIVHPQADTITRERI